MEGYTEQSRPSDSAVVDSKSRWLQHRWNSRQARMDLWAGPGAGRGQGRGLAMRRGQVLGCLCLSKGSCRARGAGSAEQRAHQPDQVRIREPRGRGPRVGIGLGVGALEVQSLSARVQALESKSQGQTWRLRSGLSCHEAGALKRLWSEKELKFVPGWRGGSDLFGAQAPSRRNAPLAQYSAFGQQDAFVCLLCWGVLAWSRGIRKGETGYR